MFNDEAIYIRWATLIREDSSNLFIPSVDGKSPLFMWVNALTLGGFDDVLLSGRIISVVAGVLTVIGIYWIGRELFGRSVGFLAAIIYSVLPFSVIHDRMALVDSLTTAFAVWMMLGAVKLSTRPQWGWVKSLALGILLGLGFLTKTPFLLFFIFPVLAMWFFSDLKNRKNWIHLGTAYLICLVLMAPYLMYEPANKVLGTDKVFHNIDIKEKVVSLVQFTNAQSASNIQEWTSSLNHYVTWPLLLILALSLIHLIKTRDRKQLFLLLWFLLPSIAIILLAGNIFSRYFLFCIPPVALLTANFFSVISQAIFSKFKQVKWITERRVWVSTSALVLLLLPALCLDVQILNSPKTAGWTQKDAWQYTHSPYSGYGIEEAVDLFTLAAKEKPIAVFLTETWGMPGDALYLYLRDHPGITIYEAWWAYKMPVFPANLGSIEIFRSKYRKQNPELLVMSSLNNKRVFFVARDHLSKPEILLKENTNLVRVQSFHPLGDSFSFSVYELDTSKKLYMTERPG